jgi:hypothetical protein
MIASRPCRNGSYVSYLGLARGEIDCRLTSVTISVTTMVVASNGGGYAWPLSDGRRTTTPVARGEGGFANRLHGDKA